MRNQSLHIKYDFDIKRMQGSSFTSEILDENEIEQKISLKSGNENSNESNS